jgi:hypothetical protein
MAQNHSNTATVWHVSVPEYAGGQAVHGSYPWWVMWVGEAAIDFLVRRPGQKEPENWQDGRLQWPKAG